MDVLDRLKNLERSTGERFPGAVVIVSRHTVVDAVVEIERLKDLIEAKHQHNNWTAVSTDCGTYRLRAKNGHENFVPHVFY